MCIYLFAFKPTKHYTHDQWIMGTILWLLQTLPLAPDPYRGTNLHL